MAEINIVERKIVPSKPKVIATEQIEIYVPIATFEYAGIASYNSDDFNIVNDKVSLKYNHNYYASKIDSLNERVTVATDLANDANLDISNLYNEVTVLSSRITNLKQDISNEAHFRGWVETIDEIFDLNGDENDFAYCVETGTVWRYTNNMWIQTGQDVPSQNIPASDLTPEPNGTASPGTSSAYSRADHVHPHDDTKVSIDKYASNDSPGLVKVSNDYMSTIVLRNGFLDIATPSVGQIQSRAGGSAITIPVLDDAIYYALTDEKYRHSLTEEQQSSIRTWLGVTGGGGTNSFEIGNSFATGLEISDDGYLSVYSSPNGMIDSRAGNGVITNANLDYAVVSAMTNETHRLTLTEEQQATACEWLDAVGKTEYATATTAGVVKGDKTYGFQVAVNGIPTCDILSASEYTGKTVACFISKGTLENAKNDIVKRAIVENDITLSDTEKAKALAWLGVNDKIGDIETVLDSVIAMQNTLIGGGV